MAPTSTYLGTAPTQKVDRRIVKTRKAIRQAFLKLLSEKGLGKITVSALAREADIDRKTFYLHFSSIDDLIDQEANVLVEKVARAISTPAAADADAAPTLSMKRVLVELAAVVEEDIALYQHVISSMSIDQMVEALKEPVRKALIASIADRGAVDEQGLDYLLHFYIAGTLSVFIHWFTGDRSLPIEQVVDIVDQATRSHGVALTTRS
ncbi:MULTISPECIES: TetR/AcrR family transcriptional regulator [unclassified Adlercreutzia]|uniref:TetR/AcrR family transcriptional regulator n=1 Tax=unclassified Adlercreutzia TaxID=2636013 RepID=UPI0013EC6B4B|nr:MULTISPECIES: TetR/AcrR family transcriptional regulator [unclassified Adlercreutzia]